MADRTYVILDASVVSAYFIPHAHRSRRVHDTVRILVEGVRKRSVDDLVLYIPNVCIPEVFGTLAKYAYGRWNRQVKKPITVGRYGKIRSAFRRYIHNGAIFEQYDLNRYHILATDLIAPVDHRYQIRKKKGYTNTPMSTIDHLVVAMGIYLSRVHDRDSVAILTADRRMQDGVRRAQSMKAATADAMGLSARAKELGYEWGVQMYPRVVHLPSAPDSDLRVLFGRWPLPTRSPRGIPPKTPGL